MCVVSDNLHFSRPVIGGRQATVVQIRMGPLIFSSPVNSFMPVAP